ncbi:MAG: hypothetical protein IJP29_01985 [Lachnospiraceae bacterium]|nr:hypothetical protein [Lachnospiraceae bacterium]
MGRKNKKDIYGIYEFPDDKPKKKKKPKKPFTIRNVIKLFVMLVCLVLVAYGVSFGVKYSMKNKAISLYEQQDYTGAIDLFYEALKPRLPLMEAFDSDVRFYIADCYINVGEYGYACQQYDLIRLWTKEDEVEGLDYLQNVAYGLQLYSWEEYRSALPILLEAYEDGYKDLVLYVGSCYGQIGDLENMQIYYNVFLQDNPMNSFMYAQYAAIALDEGNFEDAIYYIETGKQLKDQSNIKELLFDEIVYYEKMKDYNTAFQKAEDFVELYPNDIDGKNEYDVLYTRQTLTEE